MKWMSLIEISRSGDGEIVKVSDALGGEAVTAFFVDLYLKLKEPPSPCEGTLSLSQSNVKLCYLRVGDCTLTVLISTKGVEVIGGVLLVKEGSKVSTNDAKEACERALGLLLRP